VEAEAAEDKAEAAAEADAAAARPPPLAQPLEASAAGVEDPPSPSPPPASPGAALLDRMLTGLGLKSAEEEEAEGGAEEEGEEEAEEAASMAATTLPASPFGDLLRRALSGLGLTPTGAEPPPAEGGGEIEEEGEGEEEADASTSGLPDQGLRVRTGRSPPPPPQPPAGEEEKKDDDGDDGEDRPGGGVRGSRVVGAAAVAAALAGAPKAAPRPRRSRSRPRKSGGGGNGAAPPPPPPPPPAITPHPLPPPGSVPTGPIAFVANDWPTAPLALRLKYALRPAAEAARPPCAACEGGGGGRPGPSPPPCGLCGAGSPAADAYAASLARSLAGARSAFCIHNLAYQGVFPTAAWGRLCLPEAARAAVEWTPGEDDDDDGGGGGEGVQAASPPAARQLNWMRGALLASDAVITVSPSYAAEITTSPAGACGLLGPLRARGVRGIMNGLDTAEWDPAHDALLPPGARYDADGAPAGKAAAKAAFQAAHGLAVDPRPALVAYIGRLTDQKGVDVLLAAAPALVGVGGGGASEGPPIQLAALGMGSPWMEAALAGLAPSFPGAAVGLPFFEEGAAHLVAAAADIVIVPSRFEPCGLVAQAATRYGAIPVVASVGGLRDLVTPDVGFQVDAPGGANDPAAHRAAVAALVAGVRAAAAERAADGGDGGDASAPSTGAWRARQRAAMGLDVSWGRPAEEWEDALRGLWEER